MQLFKLICFIILFIFHTTILSAVTTTNISSTFTQKETSYLQDKKHITMCIDPDWMPFEKIVHNKHIGMTSDFIKLLQKSIGVPIELVPTKTWSQSIEFAKTRQCDIFSLAMQTKERAKYMSFTQPYINATLIIATRMNTLFITDPAEVIEKPLGITKGYAYIEILKEKYPNIHLVEFESLTQGLDALREGEIFGYIDNIITTGYAIQKSYYGELKIAGKFDDKWELGIGVRNDEPLLLSIFNKSIQHLSHTQYNQIINKWISIKYDKGFDYSLFWKIFLFLSIVILFGIYRHYELRKLIAALEEKDEKLQELSIKDSLSQLYNRRYFDEIFAIEFNRAKRQNQSFIFAILDIDYFKKYNDTYGHQAGDNAIIEVSKVLKSSTQRAGDFAFRVGGEEFAIISHLYQDKPYIEYFKQICQEIENLDIEHKKNPQYQCLTISIGVIEVRQYKNITIDDVYRLADEQLYLAKANGRNQVISTIV